MVDRGEKLINRGETTQKIKKMERTENFLKIHAK